MKNAILLSLALVLAAPAALAQKASQRSGEEVVKAKCAACHEKGVGGAPRIDDRAAWAQRMKGGLDATVKAAIQGHGKMPSRGGQPDLTDAELRAAILYLFNPAGIPKPAAVAALPPNVKVVGNTEVHLGLKPGSGDTYHINVTLLDAATKAVVPDATVEARVSDPVMGAQSRKLEKKKLDKAVSYENDFRISGKHPHTITITFRRPGTASTLEARFEIKG